MHHNIFDSCICSVFDVLLIKALSIPFSAPPSYFNLQNLPPEVPVGGSFSCIPLYKKCPAGDPAEHLIHNIFFLCSFNTNPDRSAAHNLFREVPFYVPDIQGMPTPSYLSTDVFLCHIPVHSRFSSDAFLRCLIHIHVLCKD